MHSGGDGMIGLEAGSDAFLIKQFDPRNAPNLHP